MIDWEKTFAKANSSQLSNYAETKELAKTSSKKVLFVCENPQCDSIHRERFMSYNYVRQKQEQAIKDGKPALCQTCSHAPRKGKVSVKKENTAVELPPQVDERSTFEAFGYYPSDLPKWSRKEILLTCDCGRESKTTRSQLNKYKSVLELGEFKCTACWTRERRTGAKASEKTKALMREAQNSRRQKEANSKAKDEKEYLEYFERKIKKRDSFKEQD